MGQGLEGRLNEKALLCCRPRLAALEPLTEPFGVLYESTSNTSCLLKAGKSGFMRSAALLL